MNWKEPKIGTVRITTKFLWLPKTLYQDGDSVYAPQWETRWWELARIVQKWGMVSEDSRGWIDLYWAK